jgi:hypothetical protein
MPAHGRRCEAWSPKYVVNDGSIAKAKGKDARHMISAAVTECLGSVVMDNYVLNRFLPKGN